MENGDFQNTEGASQSKMILGGMWVVTIFVAIFLGYIFGQASNSQSQKTVMGTYAPQYTPTPTVSIISPTSTPIPTIAQKVISKTACQKSGFAQKWDYLTAYVIKEGDSLKSIVEKELGDSSRLNEVLQLNGVGPLVAGATLYLPPDSIKKSNGKIKLLYGKLVLKNASNWQLSFNDDTEGQGILIPTFWFSEIPNKDSYKVGDCVEVLLDDGFKVFSVSLQ